MHILHVLSQYEITGAEVYAATLAREHIGRGHRVLVVSDTLAAPTPAEFIPRPIGDRRWPQRFRNIAFLSRLIRERSVDVVHAHSRAASWVAHYATRFTRTAYVSSMHWRQHLHFSGRRHNVYGTHVIAVSDSIRDHMLEDLGLAPGHVVTIPNGLDLRWWSEELPQQPRSELFGTGPDEAVILYAGRFTGPKGDVVRELVRSVIPAINVPGTGRGCALAIISGGRLPDDLRESIASLNASYGRDVVRLLGFRADLRPYVRAADLVVGSGRIGMETMVSRRPLVVFGETDYLGPMTAAGFEPALYSNLGDLGPPHGHAAGDVIADIRRVLNEGIAPGELEAVDRLARARFDVKTLASQVEEVYVRAIREAGAKKR